MRFSILLFIFLSNLLWAKDTPKKDPKKENKVAGKSEEIVKAEEAPIKNPFDGMNLTSGICVGVINSAMKDTDSWKVFKEEDSESKCQTLEQKDCQFYGEKYPEELFTFNCEGQITFHWIRTSMSFSIKNKNAWPSHDNQDGIVKCQARDNADLAKLCVPDKILEGMLKRKKAEDVLVQAIMENDRAITERLLKQKVSLNKKNKRGLLPIQAAVAQCRYEMTALLIEKKVNLNVTNEFQRNLISDSLFCADLRILQKLVENKVDVNVVDKYGETPLMIAAEAGNAEAVSILLKSGADLKFKNKKGATAYTRAKRSNNPKVLRILQNFAQTP